MESRALALLAVGPCLGLAVMIGSGCFSMSKSSVEERLLALEKNAPSRGRIETLETRVRIGGDELDARFRYGGEFVWRAALDDPRRIARVILMSSSGPIEIHGELFVALETAAEYYHVEVRWNRPHAPRPRRESGQRVGNVRTFPAGPAQKCAFAGRAAEA